MIFQNGLTTRYNHFRKSAPSKIVGSTDSTIFFMFSSAIQPTSKPASQPASQPAQPPRQAAFARPASQRSQPANQPGSQPAATQPAIEPAAGQFANQSGSTPAANQRPSPKQANYGNPSTQRQQCTPMGPNFPRELMETTHCVFYQHTALSITLEKTASPQRRNNGVQSRNCGV